MAVQPNISRSIPLYVLIIFVVLFLASATGLVLLFVQQEDLRQRAERAEKDFSDYIGPPEVKGQLDTYKGREKNRSAVAALLAEREQLAKLLTGTTDGTGQNMVARVAQILEGLPPEAADLKQQGQAGVIMALDVAARTIDGLVKQMNAAASAKKALDDNITTITKSYSELQNDFTKRAADFDAEVAKLKGQFAEYKTEYDANLQAITGRVRDELTHTLDQLDKSLSQNIDELRQMVRRNLQQVIGSMQDLGPAGARVASTMTVEKLIQRNDGQVLTLARDIAYIDLGKEQRTQPGMRFVVYSPLERGKLNPTVKAIVEVTNVADLTSEARIIHVDRNNPVVADDLIANLVYDRELKLVFFTFGEFDFNHDGRPDPKGVEEINAIISASAGEVASQLSPNVNFVVEGTEIKQPAEPGADASEENRQQYTQTLQRYREYSDLKNQVQAMGIPVIDQETFLKFTGHSTGLNGEK